MRQLEPAEQTKPKRRLLAIQEVMDRVSLSRPTIYRLIDSGQFPKPVKLSRVRAAWVESEIDAWIEQKMEAREA